MHAPLDIETKQVTRVSEYRWEEHTKKIRMEIKVRGKRAMKLCARERGEIVDS